MVIVKQQTAAGSGSTTLINHSAVVAVPNANVAPQNGVKYCPNHSLTQAITKTARKNMLTTTMKSK